MDAKTATKMADGGEINNPSKSKTEEQTGDGQNYEYSAEGKNAKLDTGRSKDVQTWSSCNRLPYVDASASEEEQDLGEDKDTKITSTIMANGHLLGNECHSYDSHPAVAKESDVLVEMRQPGQGKRHKYASALKRLKPFRPHSKKSEEFPMVRAGLCSFLVQHFLASFVWKTFRSGTLDPDLLWKLPVEDNSDTNSKRLERLWNEEVKRVGLEKASLGKVIMKFVRTRVLVNMIMLVILLVAAFVGPTFVIKALLSYISSPESNMGYGLALALALFCTELTRSIAFASFWNINYQTASRAKGAMIAMLFGKILRLRSMKQKTIGELVNMCANDAQRLFDAISMAPLVLGGPFVLVAGTAYGMYILGPWILAGVLVFMLYYPYQVFISRVITRLRRQAITVTDHRVRLMNEILTCIKLIKLYAWEKPFAKTIAEVRKREKKVLEKAAFVNSMSVAFTPLIAIFAAIVTFIGHTMSGNDLSATQLHEQP